MLKIVYCKEGVAISDYEVEKFVDEAIKDYLSHSVNTTIKVSSEILLMVFQERMLKGDIGYENIKFFIEDEEIENSLYKGFILPENKRYGIFFAEYVMWISKILLDNCRRNRETQSK